MRGQITIDLAMSVIALRWKNAPLEAYQQITCPPLTTEQAQAVQQGTLAFVREGNNWQLMEVCHG